MEFMSHYYYFEPVIFYRMSSPFFIAWYGGISVGTKTILVIIMKVAGKLIGCPVILAD